MANDKSFKVKNDLIVEGGKLYLNDDSGSKVSLEKSGGNLNLYSDNLVRFYESDGSSLRSTFDLNDVKFAFGPQSTDSTTTSPYHQETVSIGNGYFNLNVKNLSQFRQPICDYFGNELLYSDKYATFNTTGTITSSTNVFRPGDNYCSFIAASNGANPVTFEILKEMGTTTDVNARFVGVMAHSAFTTDMKIEVKNAAGTYETIEDFAAGNDPANAINLPGQKFVFFDLVPQISYDGASPGTDDWSVKGVKFYF